MGEARRRGNYIERRETAVVRNREKLIESLGGRDLELEAHLRAGLAMFLERLPQQNWSDRRANIIEYLVGLEKGDAGLANAGAIRFREDEIGWYLFLAEEALKNPLCVDVSQSQRALPYIAGIGIRAQYSHKVKGFQEKIDELLHTYKSAPDGGIFELCVALSYASKGWDVEFIPTQRGAQIKTPDMVVRKGEAEFFIECKRQDRRAAYAEEERTAFLKLWDKASSVLKNNAQWIWLKASFHAEPKSLPEDFLESILQKSLPIRTPYAKLYDGVELTLEAKILDKAGIQEHFNQMLVKANSPSLNKVLGGDWVPTNASVTLAAVMRHTQLIDCAAPVLGSFVDDVGWVAGITRVIDSEIALDKKARDIKKLLADAVKQVPGDKPSIIHIAAETLEGQEVERRRTRKVMESIPGFVTEKPVKIVRFHRFMPNNAVDSLFQFDETINTFATDEEFTFGLPNQVVIADDVEMQDGAHWDIYPDE